MIIVPADKYYECSMVVKNDNILVDNAIIHLTIKTYNGRFYNFVNNIFDVTESANTSIIVPRIDNGLYSITFDPNGNKINSSYAINGLYEDTYYLKYTVDDPYTNVFFENIMFYNFKFQANIL